MSYQKIARLVSLLARRTISGEVEWEKTEEANEYQASFSEYSVRLSSERSSDGDAYSLKVFDWAGDIVEEISDDDLLELIEDPNALMREMYEVARRKVMGVEDALDTILRQLGQDEDFF